MKYQTVKCMDWIEGESFPYLELNDNENVHYRLTSEQVYICFQPDYWDNEEFNMIILIEDRPIRVRGCHFE